MFLVCCNDYSIEVRPFLFISYSNDENAFIQVVYLQFVVENETRNIFKHDKNVQKNNELVGHQSIRDSSFQCKALFDQQFQL